MKSVSIDMIKFKTIGFDFKNNEELIIFFIEDFLDYYGTCQMTLSKEKFTIKINERQELSSPDYNEFNQIMYNDFENKDNAKLSFHFNDYYDPAGYDSQEIIINDIHFIRNDINSLMVEMTYELKDSAEYDFIKEWFDLVAYTINKRKENNSDMLTLDYSFEFLFRFDDETPNYDIGWWHL